MRGPEYQAERSQRQRDRILSLLRISPLTTAQLAERMFLHRSTVINHITVLRRSNQIHIGSHAVDSSSGMGRISPIWSAGEGADAVYLSKTKKATIRKQTFIPGRLEDVERLLTGQQRTAREVSILMGLSLVRTRSYIRMLRDQKRVFVKGWTTVGDTFYQAPLYLAGKGKDKPIKRATAKEYYQRIKTQPERYDKMLAKKNAQHYVNGHLKKPQSIFAALGI